MSEQKRPFMDEEDFDALLARSVPEMPPDDIVARTIPGKEALGRILTGYFLYTFVIHFIGLDLILPVIGQILVLLGFRALQHENRWFNACYLLEVMHAVYLFGTVILNTTIIELPDMTMAATLAVYYLQSALTVLSLICFWCGLRTVQKKMGMRSPTAGVLALIALNVLVAVMGTLQLRGNVNFGSLYVFAFLVICYLVALWLIARLARSLDETGYVLQPSPVQISDHAYTLILVVLLAIGCACGYLFFSNYTMDWHANNTQHTPATQETKAQLAALGFPEEILEDLAPQDLAKLDGAKQVVVKAVDNNEGTFNAFDKYDIRLTSVAAYIPGETPRIVLFHHFRWRTPPDFFGTETFDLLPAYESYASWGADGTISGRVLYDDGDTTLASEYASINTHQVTSAFSSLLPTQNHVFANFTFPKEGENQRGYLIYTITPRTDVQQLLAFNSQPAYIHQTYRLRYPAVTAESYVTTHKGGAAFDTITSSILLYELTDEGLVPF